MPWLPLAILVVAALTIAALALILFPPGEGGAQVGEDDITEGVRDETAEANVAEDVDEAATGVNLTPPPPGGDPPLAREDEEPLRESAPSAGPDRPPGRKLHPLN
jgi:hypothetical protein